MVNPGSPGKMAVKMEHVFEFFAEYTELVVNPNRVRIVQLCVCEV